MEKFVITLLAESHPQGTIYGTPKEKVTVECTDNGVCIEKQEISDIYYNGIQLRLYTSGSHKDNENVGTSEPYKAGFYMMFETNENDAGLSLYELHEKIFGAFVLYP